MNSLNNRVPGWSVSTLIDFEYALLREPIGDAMRKWRRDREIFTSFQEHAPNRVHTHRRAAFAYWLQAARMQRTPLPGRNIVKACDILATLLILVSFFLGLSYASGLLVALDNRDHVSAIAVFILTIGLQWLVLLVGLAVTLLRRRRSVDGEIDSIQLSLLSGVIKRSGSRLRGSLATLDSVRSKYSSLLVAKIFKASQWCVAALSFGIVVSLVAYHFSVREVRFGWTATHNFTAEEISKAVNVVAKPWMWLLPSAKPSFSDVRDSRLTRERSDSIVSHETSRAWAAFLVMSLLTYGVAFRIFLVALASNWAKRAIAGVAFDGHLADALWERMTTEPPPEPPPPTPAPTQAPPPPPPRLGWLKRLLAWLRQAGDSLK